MALYDNRVFKTNDKWWVAEVHGGSGTASSFPPRITQERIIFTCLSDDRERSRTASLPARRLRSMAHESLLDVLEKSERFTDSRLPLRPSNMPDPDELSSGEAVTDSGGLRWIIRKTTQLRVVDSNIVESDALEAICLDDSAMRREIALDNRTYDKQAVIERVRSLFKPYLYLPEAL